MLIRLELSEYLRSCGYKVIEAGTADEPRFVLNDQRGSDISIVLSFVDRPGELDGFGLAKWTRENKPAIKFVLVGNLERAAQTAADLCKSGPHREFPFEPQTLLARMRRGMATHSPADIKYQKPPSRFRAEARPQVAQ